MDEVQVLHRGLRRRPGHRRWDLTEALSRAPAEADDIDLALVLVFRALALDTVKLKQKVINGQPWSFSWLKFCYARAGIIKCRQPVS